jgi:hypothetical protein
MNNRYNERKHVIKVGSFNANGLRNKLPDVYEKIQQLDLDWLFICETHWKVNSRDPPCCVSNGIGKQYENSRPQYGTMIITNPNKKDDTPFEILACGEEGKLQVWRWKSTLFIGCHIPPESDGEIDEKWLDILTNALALRRPDEPVVILGDLNMRLGSLVGDHVTNGRAKSIGKLLFEGEGFRYHRTRDEDSAPYTCSRGPKGRSVVDYILTSSDIAMIGYTHDYDDLRSDHQLIYATLQIPQNRDTHAGKTIKYLYHGT